MTALALLRRFWWAVPIAALVAALLLTRATLADRTATLQQERAAWTQALRDADVRKVTAERNYALRLSAAADSYATRLASIDPIIVRSTDTVRTYAQTDAGRARCLDADRVRGIDALDRDLAAATGAASRSADPVPADAGAAPVGRDRQQR